MKSKFQIEVEIPTLEEFAAKYPPYGNWAREQGRPIFDLLTEPENFLRARFATELGLPAVAGIAHLCEAIFGEGLKNDFFVKQAIGAIVATLLEANGFVKTGERKAITQKSFTKGMTYKEKT